MSDYQWKLYYRQINMILRARLPVRHSHIARYWAKLASNTDEDEVRSAMILWMRCGLIGKSVA
jgi:hypothetical protein